MRAKQDEALKKKIWKKMVKSFETIDMHQLLTDPFDFGKMDWAEIAYVELCVIKIRDTLRKIKAPK